MPSVPYWASPRGKARSGCGRIGHLICHELKGDQTDFVVIERGGKLIAVGEDENVKRFTDMCIA